MDEDTQVLAVILARVRCELIHDQTNGGRCLSCIAWAKRTAPRHAPRLAVHDARVRAEALAPIEALVTGEPGSDPQPWVRKSEVRAAMEAKG